MTNPNVAIIGMFEVKNYIEWYEEWCVKCLIETGILDTDMRQKP